LKNLNASPKMKTMEEKGIRVRSLTHNISKVKGCVGALRWGLGVVSSKSIIHTNQTTSWIMHVWNIFGARTSHEHTWTRKTHKIHHGPNLGEATTFPFIVFFVISHRSHIQMSFCLGTPKFGILKFLKLGLPTLWKDITCYPDL
jgi:hypothetical protein